MRLCGKQSRVRFIDSWSKFFCQPLLEGNQVSRPYQNFSPFPNSSILNATFRAVLIFRFWTLMLVSILTRKMEWRSIAYGFVAVARGLRAPLTRGTNIQTWAQLNSARDSLDADLTVIIRFQQAAAQSAWPPQRSWQFFSLRLVACTG